MVKPIRVCLEGGGGLNVLKTSPILFEKVYGLQSQPEGDLFYFLSFI